MNRENINSALLFIGLIFLQIIVLNNINFLGYINPYFYIFFIFLYPIKKGDASILILSFLLGLFIAIFSASGGINAAATLLTSSVFQDLSTGMSMIRIFLDFDEFADRLD